MGEIDNTANSPYFDGWEKYVDSQLQDDAPTQDEYFGLNQDEETGKEPGAFQQIVGGGINTVNHFLEDNLKKPIEGALKDTFFEVEEGSTSGGEGTGKPARLSFHNFTKDPICVENCLVQCPFGMTFCKIQATPMPRQANVEGSLGIKGQMLTINDHFAFTNVFPYNLFTICQNPFNPYVIWATALATAAKGGVFTFTPWLCVGSVPLFSYVQPFWKPTQIKVKTNGLLALTQSSTISCWWPGELKIVHPGQGLDASWGKAMFLGPGGLAGIQNIVNMAGAVFSVAGGFAKSLEVLNKAASICDLLDGSINLMSGDIIGALFSGVSGAVGLGGDNIAINRGIKKIADFTSDLFNKGIKRIEIADVYRSARSLGDDMPPSVRNQYHDNLDKAGRAADENRHLNADGTLATPNTPHGDTISVSSNHPHGGDAPETHSGNVTGTGSTRGSGSANSNNWKAKYRSEADVPSVEKRKEAREAYRKWKDADDQIAKNPPVSQKEKEYLSKLEREKNNAHKNLNDHPEPSRTEMDNKKAQSDASKQKLENTPKPAEPDYNTLKAKKKAVDDAKAKMETNRVTPEERQHLKELEARYQATTEKYTNDISMANNEADIKAWKEFEAEKARIAEKDRLFKEGQNELAVATPEYNQAKRSVENAEKKQQEYKDLQDKVKSDEDAYLSEKRQYDKKMDEHNKAKTKAKEADNAYNKEEKRQKDKQKKHDDAVAEADRLRPDNATMKLGKEQDAQSDLIQNVSDNATSEVLPDADGINDWAKEVKPEEQEKPETPPVDTSWIGYDFTLDY